MKLRALLADQNARLQTAASERDVFLEEKKQFQTALVDSQAALKCLARKHAQELQKAHRQHNEERLSLVQLFVMDRDTDTLNFQNELMATKAQSDILRQSLLDAKTANLLLCDEILELKAAHVEQLDAQMTFYEAQKEQFETKRLLQNTALRQEIERLAALHSAARLKKMEPSPAAISEANPALSLQSIIVTHY